MRSAMEPAEVRAQKAARAGPGSWRQGWLTRRHSASIEALRPSGWGLSVPRGSDE